MPGDYDNGGITGASLSEMQLTPQEVAEDL